MAYSTGCAQCVGAGALASLAPIAGGGPRGNSRLPDGNSRVSTAGEGSPTLPLSACAPEYTAGTCTLCVTESLVWDLFHKVFQHL